MLRQERKEPFLQPYKQFSVFFGSQWILNYYFRPIGLWSSSYGTFEIINAIRIVPSRTESTVLCPILDKPFSHPPPEWFFLGRTLKEFFMSSEHPFFQGKRLRGLSRLKKSPCSTFLSSEENRKHMQVKARTLGKVYPLSSTANHFLSSLGKGVIPATSWSPAVVVREGSIRWKPLEKEWWPALYELLMIVPR